MAISKTGFMRGMQCEKMLWLDRHKPSLRIIPEEVQARLQAGNEFGDQAMGIFGPYEEMTIYRPGSSVPDTRAMASKTKEHLLKGTPVICEAAFFDYNNYCAVDILRKCGDSYEIYEVKNSPEVTQQHIRDAAFQYYIVKRNGIAISGIYIVINSGKDDNPFLITEVTEQVKELYKWVNDNIWRLNAMQKEKEEPDIACGSQCDDPYECWYYAYCHHKQETLF